MFFRIIFDIGLILKCLKVKQSQIYPYYFDKRQNGNWEVMITGGKTWKTKICICKSHSKPHRLQQRDDTGVKQRERELKKIWHDTEMPFSLHHMWTHRHKTFFDHIKIKHIEMTTENTGYDVRDVPCQRVILQWSDECSSCK